MSYILYREAANESPPLPRQTLGTLRAMRRVLSLSFLASARRGQWV